MKNKRIVFKVGTSSLTNQDGSLSRSKVKAITQQLALLHEQGHELILVSSGAIAAGFGALGFTHPRTGEVMEFSVEVPEVFQKTLEQLRQG